MKQKKLTLLVLLITILSLFIVGCQKKVSFNTGDAELDAELEKVWEEEKKLNQNSNNDDNDDDNITQIDILESFFITKENTNYMLFKVKVSDEFAKEINLISTTSGIKATLIGENNGSEKEIATVLAKYAEQKLHAGSLSNNLDIVDIVNKNEKYLLFEVDWDGYSSYLLKLTYEELIFSTSGNDKNIISSDYKILDNDIRKISYDDFIANCYNEMFNNVSDKSASINDVEITPLELKIENGRLSTKIQFENKSSVPTDGVRYFIKYITGDNNNYGYNNSTYVPSIAPNDKYILEQGMNIEGYENYSLDSNKEFIIEILTDYKELSDICYIKGKNHN